MVRGSKLTETWHVLVVLFRLLLLKGHIHHLQMSKREVSTASKPEHSSLASMRGEDAELPILNLHKYFYYIRTDLQPYGTY